MDGSANLHWTNSAHESNSTSEKRRHPRFYLNLPIEFRVTDAPSIHGAMIVNASETGLLIQSPHNMAVGTILNIAVLFSKGFELANFKVSAEVVWTKAYSEERRKMYQLGLRFIKISEEDRQKLKHLLGDGQ
jgi:hypothetical protein